MNDTPSQAPDKAGVVEITQADRDAAADYVEKGYGDKRLAARMRRGEGAFPQLVQAFARHRLAALSPPPVVEEAGQCPGCTMLQQRLDAVSMLCGDDFIQSLHDALDQRGAPRGDGSQSTYGLVQRILTLSAPTPPVGEEAVELAASAMYAVSGSDWKAALPATRESYRRLARAALAALPTRGLTIPEELRDAIGLILDADQGAPGYGLHDCIDNDDQAYQSATLAAALATLTRVRQALSDQESGHVKD